MADDYHVPKRVSLETLFEILSGWSAVGAAAEPQYTADVEVLTGIADAVRRQTRFLEDVGVPQRAREAAREATEAEQALEETAEAAKEVQKPQETPRKKPPRTRARAARARRPQPNRTRSRWESTPTPIRRTWKRSWRESAEGCWKEKRTNARNHVTEGETTGSVGSLFFRYEMG